MREVFPGMESLEVDMGGEAARLTLPPACMCQSRPHMESALHEMAIRWTRPRTASLADP